MLGQQFVRPHVRGIQQRLDLLVDDPGCMLRDFPPAGELATEEDLLLTLAHRHEANPLAHPEGGYHLARDVGGHLDVGTRTGGDLLRAELELLGHPAAEADGEPAHQELTGVAVPVLVGQ